MFAPVVVVLSMIIIEQSSYAVLQNQEAHAILNRDKTGTHPVEVVDPVVFEPENLDGLKAFFQENGYVVVDHVSEAKLRYDLVHLIERIATEIPQARRLGFMDLYHDNLLAQMRQNPTLYSVFASIFGTEKLWVVFDRVMYWGKEEGDQPLAPHVDQNPLKHLEFSDVQAMLALRDMNEGTGTLALVPRSQTFFSEYAQWARPKDGYIEYQKEAQLPFIAPRLKAGQIILWDSRVTHSRFRDVPTSNRYAVLLTFLPAKDDSSLTDLRLQYFRDGTGWSNHEAGLRATARPRYESSLRQNPETLTELGMKLYGLVSWFSE